jgi:hypothetical protein
VEPTQPVASSDDITDEDIRRLQRLEKLRQRGLGTVATRKDYDALMEIERQRFPNVRP